VVVANAVCGNDGRWSALHASFIYQHGRTAGFVYQSALRAGLVSRLGVRFEPPHNGMSEIAGVPARLMKDFSTRRTEVEAHLEDIGSGSARAAQIAALQTRHSKEAPATGTLVGLHDRWREESRAFGFDPGDLTSVLGRPRR
jgi:conjugative relaxase-like TrwC/TraI family protein